MGICRIYARPGARNPEVAVRETGVPGTAAPHPNERNREMIIPRMALASGPLGLPSPDAAAEFRADDSAGAAEEFEILHTPPGVVVETRVKGTFRHAHEVGLRRLRAYLRGNNSAAAHLPMADTVIQCPEQPGLWRLQILVRRESEGHIIPRPRSRKVRCAMVGAETLAVVRLRWWHTWRGVSEARLLSALRDSRWIPEGPCKLRIATWPYLPWFLCPRDLAVAVHRRTEFA